MMREYTLSLLIQWPSSSKGPGKYLLSAIKIKLIGTCLVVQWLGLSAPTAGGHGLNPDWGSKMLQTARGSP